MDSQFFALQADDARKQNAKRKWAPGGARVVGFLKKHRNFIIWSRRFCFAFCVNAPRNVAFDFQIALSFSAMNLIFLHYFGGGPASWNDVVAHLDEFSAQTPDLREVGRWPGGYSVREAAINVMQIVGDQNESFVLIGHSMGGKIAVEIAARQPENLRGCVLIAPSPPSPEPMSDADRADMLRGHGTREAAERIVQGAVGRRNFEPKIGKSPLKRIWRMASAIGRTGSRSARAKIFRQSRKTSKFRS